MRKVIAIFLSLLLLILAGCVEAEMHLVVNRDGSADLSFQLGMNKALLLMMAAEGENPFAEVADEMRQEGFTVSNYTEGNMSGIRGERHLPSVTAAEMDVFDAEGDGLVVKKGLFTTRYIFDLEMDMEMDEDDEFAQLLMSQLDLTTKITLPAKVTTHNADSVSKDRKTLTWNMRPGEQTTLQFTVTEPNYLLIGVLTGVAMLLILASGAIIFARRKKSQSIQSALTSGESNSVNFD